MIIESWLSKKADDRISDWDEIRKSLQPVASQYTLPLEPDELAVVVRFRDTSHQHLASIINVMKKFLQDEGVNHEIEIHRGGDDDSK